jgi:opine dehydrogenase
MAPHLVDGQVVYLPPGTSAASRWTASCAAGNQAAVTYAETGTLPWLARNGAAEVAITIRALHLPTGVYPQQESRHALALISKAFPGVIEDCGDALSGALMNAGPIIHPPLILMNAAPLQHFERWDIHNEGTQPAVRAVTTALDAERIATREALGYGAPHFPLADHYDNDRWMYGDAHKKLTDSGDWRECIDLHTHRYMLEDTVLGLAFLASVARHAQVDAPVAHGLLALAGAILGRDLRLGPRTFDALGWPFEPRAAANAAAHGGRMIHAERIACVGAGRMGRGMAIAFAYAGMPVTLIDLKPRSADAWAQLSAEASAELRSSLQLLSQLGAVH